VTKFRQPEEFIGSAEYQLLPFFFRRLPSRSNEVLLTNDIGEHAWLDQNSFLAFSENRLPVSHPAFWDLESKHFLARRGEPLPLESMAVQYRSRKAYLMEGPALHIFVVTLRCNHSCGYCQVSRQLEGAGIRFELSQEHARLAIRHVLSSPARAVTIEFQGGEPLLAFDTIRFIVETVTADNVQVGKDIRFVIATTLHHLTDEKLAFIRDHRIELSTSLDGPEDLHNANRPVPGRDSHRRTIEGIVAARRILGNTAVAALTTLTRKSIACPEAIVDAYRDLGFHSIFLRPLSPYGFAAKSGRLDYSVNEFLGFYRKALDHLIAVNLAGYPMDEAYAALLLRNILTPFSNGYVDLRSPAGAGFGVWVYNYDGRVYASDEARMLAEMGDDTFCLGHVGEDYETLLTSPAMLLLASGAVAESIPGCADCAYLPFCGSDPIDSYRRQGDVIGHRPSSAFCARHMGILDLLFEKLRNNDPDEMRVLHSWVHRRPLAQDYDEHGAAARL